MTVREDEETRSANYRAMLKAQEANREERLALLAGDEAERQNNVDRWEPLIRANAEKE